MGVISSERLVLGLPGMAVDILSRIRRRHPRVHCLTNSVAENFTANALLAVGAAPSMTTAPEEIADFVRAADALVVNLGTLDDARRKAAGIAALAAAEEQVPWVLDPVFVDRSPLRNDFARALMARSPTAIRLNISELNALAGPGFDNEAALKCHALEQRRVMALTGGADTVTDGTRSARIENGDPLMGRVTATGCAASALVAACLAVEGDSWLAATAGLLVFAIAGECAAQRARGPGSFSVEILDALADLEEETVLARAKVR